MEVLNDKLKCQLRVQSDVNRRLKKIDFFRDTEVFDIYLNYVEAQIKYGKELYGYLIRIEEYRKNSSVRDLFHLLLINEGLLSKFNSKQESDLKEKIM